MVKELGWLLAQNILHQYLSSVEESGVTLSSTKLTTGKKKKKKRLLTQYSNAHNILINMNVNIILYSKSMQYHHHSLPTKMAHCCGL